MASKKLTPTQMRQMVAASQAAKRKPAKKATYRPYGSVPGDKRMPGVQLGGVRELPPLKHKILPCPFCKSTEVELETGVCYPYVRCCKCQAHGPYIYYRIGTDKVPEQTATVKLWNAAHR